MADVEQAMKLAMQNGSYPFPQSAAFKGDAQLLSCSQSDGAHIGRFTAASKPQAVRKLQAALEAIFKALGMPYPPGPRDAAGTYGNSTAAAVAALKKRIGLLNFAGQIDDIIGIKTVRALDAAQAALKLDQFTLHFERFLFGHLVGCAILHRRFHILQTLDRLANGLEVGEHAAQPTMVDKRRGATFGFFTNDFLGLAFGSNE